MIIALIGGLIALYLYAIKPASPKRKNLKPFVERYYAHRGLFNNKSTAPENSINAFKLAIENNYGIELDVRLTKDKIPVVVHDENLKRVANISKNIIDMTFEELNKVTLFNSNETIPTLSQVLKLIDGKLPVIVEIKLDQGYNTEICDFVSPILDSYKGEYVVESFNPMVVLWYKKNRPFVIRGQLSTNHLKESNQGLLLSFLLQYLMFNFLVKPDFIAYDHRYGNNISLVLNRKLFKTITMAYTLKSQDELNKAENFFQIYIFDSFIPL